jgi:hypothetical protein
MTAYRPGAQSNSRNLETAAAQASSLHARSRLDQTISAHVSGESTWAMAGQFARDLRGETA